jgi:rare lipoprotein A (peptidoglycan hydrolase)
VVVLYRPLQELELPVQEQSVMNLHYQFVCEAIMRLLSRIAIAIVSAWMGIQVYLAAAQTFDERWSIIPKAKAEPLPEADGPIKPDPQTQSQIGAEPRRDSRRDSRDGSAPRIFKGGFAGKASYYAYRTGKTASGSSFNRNLPTAAHRSLPFGTRVRVTDPATSKSVMVVINDRGPRLPGRVLDLSLDAARILGMTDRGVVHVRAEVL